MTTMDLRELLEKTADTDFLREMIGFTAQRLPELELETLTGAEHGSGNRSRHPPQRLPWARLGHPCRNGRIAHPENPQGQLLPGSIETAADGRVGADRGQPIGLHPGRRRPLGRRPVQATGKPLKTTDLS